MEITTDWTPSPVSVEKGVLQAYRRVVTGKQTWESYVSEHLRSIIDDGGLLLQRVQNPKNIREVVNPGGIVSYQYDLPDVELWYLPRCSFEQSLDLLNVFGFPGESICTN